MTTDQTSPPNPRVAGPDHGGSMSVHNPFRLSVSTPAGYAEMLIRGRLDRALGRSGDDRRDVGASVVEWVIISALLVAIAVAVGAVLLLKLQTKAESINLDTGTP
jgi:hypothetical protein